MEVFFLFVSVTLLPLIGLVFLPSTLDKCIENCQKVGNSFGSIANLGQSSNSTTISEDNGQSNCRKQCQEEQKESKKVSIIGGIIVGSLILFGILLCVCRKLFKKKWVVWKEKHQRKPVSNNLTQQEFQSFADQFRNIFTEGERQMWEFSFVEKRIPKTMQWFSLDMTKQSPFQYSLNLKGQDAVGVWEADGYFVNTAKGITAWWFKNYQEVAGMKQPTSVFQLIRGDLGIYKGSWYSTKQNKMKEQVLLKKRFGSDNPAPGQINADQIQYDVISMRSDERM